MNIYQRINEIKKEIKYIKKDAKVQSYTAVSHDMVTASTRELFIKHGVFCYPTLKSKDWIPASGEAKQGRYDAIYIISFVNVDDPKDFFSIEIGSQGLDSQDKAPGKTISMAKKMAVLKVLDLESGDSEESRIKEDVEFDSVFYCEILKDSKTMESLKENYINAVNLATSAKDSKAIKMLAETKDEVKKLLESKK